MRTALRSLALGRSAVSAVGHQVPASSGQSAALLPCFVDHSSSWTRGFAASPAAKPKSAPSAPETSSPSQPKPDKPKPNDRLQTRGRGTMGYTPPPSAMQSNRQLHMSMSSPGVIAEPYRGELPPLPWAAWVTRAGWSERKQRFLASAKSIYTLAKLRKHLKPWSLPDFKMEALEVYQRVCAATAEGNQSALRQLVTNAEMSNLKRQLKARQDGAWARVHWGLAAAVQPHEMEVVQGRLIVADPKPHEMEVVQGRLIVADPKDEASGFAQLTARVRARHLFAAYDGKGRLVAGQPDKEFPVQDVWVFERKMNKGDPAAQWRVAGRLSLPPTQATGSSIWQPSTWFGRR